jgi:hypothetical protein
MLPQIKAKAKENWQGKYMTGAWLGLQRSSLALSAFDSRGPDSNRPAQHCRSASFGVTIRKPGSPLALRSAEALSHQWGSGAGRRSSPVTTMKFFFRKLPKLCSQRHKSIIIVSYNA